MYVDEPGDLKQEEEEGAAERAQEVENLNQDEEGKLTVTFSSTNRKRYGGGFSNSRLELTASTGVQPLNRPQSVTMRPTVRGTSTRKTSMHNL